MIFGASPIVTNGLILNLDAGNSKSYPGSGITWTDLSGNRNTGTLTPGASGLTFNRDGGGSLVFDGTDDYVETNYTLPSNSSFTITAWAKSSVASVQNRVFGNADSVSGTSGVDIIWGYVGSTQIYCVRRNGANNGTLDTQSTAITNLLTGWHHIVYTYSTTAGSILYVDGIQVGSNVNLGFSSTLTFRVGRDGNGSDKFNGNVSQVQIYNRALSASEVLQNYNALKSRYDIQPPLYESLTYVASANITLTNNGTDSVNMFKTSGTSAWDNHCYSATPFTAPCTIEFDKQAAATDNGLSYAMIGWNADPTTNASYTSLDHASYPYRADTYSVYNNGTQVLFSGAWSTANKFYIVYGTDGYIRHYNGSTLLYSANYGIGQTVYVDTSFYSVNATYGGFSNVRVRKSAWTGTNYGY